MKIKITAGAKKFGYIIWNKKNGAEIEKQLHGVDKVHVYLNGFDLGIKNVDYKYHRIPIGYKFTRALPETHNCFSIKISDGKVEVKTINV